MTSEAMLHDLRDLCETVALDALPEPIGLFYLCNRPLSVRVNVADYNAWLASMTPDAPSETYVLKDNRHWVTVGRLLETQTRVRLTCSEPVDVPARVVGVPA